VPSNDGFRDFGRRLEAADELLEGIIEFEDADLPMLGVNLAAVGVDLARVGGDLALLG
jgi:hypothetical protein